MVQLPSPGEAGFQDCTMHVRCEQAGHAITELISNFRRVEDHTLKQ